MPHWLICTSSSKALAALSAVALLARGDAGTRVADDVRPRMAVTVSIEGDDFAELLAPASRDTLVQLMGDSLLTLLEQNFGFLEWRGSGNRPDTLQVGWTQRLAAPRDAQLQLTLRGRTIGTENALPPLPFEKWARLLTRRWQPVLVSREWSATLDTVFKRQRGDLVAHLFGRMPLSLTSLEPVVQLLGRDLKAVIRLRSDQIHAAKNATPEFMVRVTVRDTAPPRTVGEGELELRRCLLSEDQPPSYVCLMKRLVYQEDTTTAEARQGLLARAVLIPRSLHLLRYDPSRVITGPGGTVAP